MTRSPANGLNTLTPIVSDFCWTCCLLGTHEIRYAVSQTEHERRFRMKVDIMDTKQVGREYIYTYINNIGKEKIVNEEVRKTNNIMYI